MDQRFFLETGIIRDIITINSADAWLKCILQPDDFKINPAKRIFQKMRELDFDGKKPYDIVETGMALHDSLFAFFNNITCGDYDNYPWGPEFIHGHQLQLLQLNNRTIVSEIIANFGNSDPKTIKQKSKEHLSKQIFKNEDQKKNIFSEIFAEYELLSEGKKRAGLQTGYKSLDELIYGFRSGEAYVVAGRPSMGKSVFALNLAVNVAKEGTRVLWFALEETKANIIKRITAHLTQINIYRLMMGYISADENKKEWAKIIDAHAAIEKLPLIIEDDAGLDSQEICRRIKKHQQKEKIDIVFVDHLQEMTDKAQNRHLAISGAMGNIKTICKKIEIPVVFLSQINRGVETRVNQKPCMADLKESGDIEQKADCIMLIHRPAYYDKTSTDNSFGINIAKARNGQTGSVDLVFDGATMTIGER
jgi:replicative DNA helicase